MGDEPPSMPVIVERIANVQEDVTEIKNNMATKTDQAHVDQRIASLTGALEKEAAERKAAIEAEKVERVAAIKEEAKAREAVAARLQVVEDRMEARKYNVGIAIILACVGALLSSVELARGLFGG